MAGKQHDTLPEHVVTDTQRLASGERVVYYRYVFPDGRRRSLGRDRADAIKAALVLNERTGVIREELRARALLARATDPLVGGNPPLDAVANAFASERCGHLAPNTLANRTYQLNKIKKRFGRTPIQNITTYDVAQFLKPMTANAHKQHRNTLKQLWVFAMEEGHANVNPVDNTRAVAQPNRTRKRHTWKGYQAIFTQSPHWLKLSMKLALYSVQRRSDLVSMTWDRVDLNKRVIYITQQKTGTDLAIKMGDELFAVINAFANTGLDSPFVVHRKPLVRNKVLMDAVRDGRQHLYQVTPDVLTKEFRKARDRTNYYAHLPPTQRPAFHDLRALGIFALAKAGYPVEYIQALAGHADKTMTQHYMRGHEQVRPLEVEAGLSLDKVDWDKVDWDESLSTELETLIHSVDDSPNPDRIPTE